MTGKLGRSGVLGWSRQVVVGQLGQLGYGAGQWCQRAGTARPHGGGARLSRVGQRASYCCWPRWLLGWTPSKEIRSKGIGLIR